MRFDPHGPVRSSNGMKMTPANPAVENWRNNGPEMRFPQDGVFGSFKELAEMPTFRESYQLRDPELVGSAKFLATTKSTGCFMFDPRSLCRGEHFVRSYRAKSLIVLYSCNVEYRVFKVLRQFCLAQTRFYAEHGSPNPSPRRNIHRKDYESPYAGVIALKQVSRSF